MNQENDLKSWAEIEECIKILVEKIQDTGKQFKTIYTISRGGLVPARLVADRLNIKQILVDEETISEDALFVDDIYDSGETFRKIMPRVESQDALVFATLFARRKNHYPRQLIYAKQTKNSEYVVFPWDRFERGFSD
jgi:hypoxanthine phosphoribosyltransferase